MSSREYGAAAVKEVGPVLIEIAVRVGSCVFVAEQKRRSVNGKRPIVKDKKDAISYRQPFDQPKSLGTPAWCRNLWKSPACNCKEVP